MMRLKSKRKKRKLKENPGWKEIRQSLPDERNKGGMKTRKNCLVTLIPVMRKKLVLTMRKMSGMVKSIESKRIKKIKKI